MKQDVLNKALIDTISKCQKEFDVNLKNKKIMFVYEDNFRNIDKEEMIFPVSCFYHLTGIKAYDINGNMLNSYNFYKLLKNNSIDAMKIIPKNRTTYYKLDVLPQLMRIDRNANMIGEFNGSNLFLQTQKVAGNVNACMGFVKNDEYGNTFIPNTALKEDIRRIVDVQHKVIAIFKKDMSENLYANITYLKKNYQIKDIFKNEDISKIVDIDKIYSADRSIDKKIYEFMYENIEENNDEPDITDE